VLNATNINPLTRRIYQSNHASGDKTH